MESHGGGGHIHKPAVQSTQFWITLGTFIVSGLVITGVVSQENFYGLSGTTTHVIEAVIMVLVQLGIIGKYVSTRRKSKEKSVDNEHELEQHELEQEKPQRSEPDGPRRTKRQPKNTSVRPRRKHKRET
jgi:hypothetical protein